MDLGYDNKTVAAKCWAALFAAREWALRVEQGLIKAQPEEHKKTWSELVQQIRENELDKVLLAAWEPRILITGEVIPNTGDPSVFAESSPEQKLAEFLTFWKLRNYGRMAQCLPSMFGGTVKKLAGQVREMYGSKHLEEFEFQKVTDEAAAITSGDVPSLLHSNRHLRDVLRAKGYEVEYSEFNGRHDHIGWRGSLSQGLVKLLK